ncbi:hypothetical protein K7X08_028364 [Anisodus acutangulus]|uniref:Exostosin GT47 domain-containing protein n=1 Tax=Anisodus acutangulus TaxID=402998 RepID=A0A9Q1REC4_9SOLA|nr:hypothetical protein K7X08_028364 [Anisodus acutangulus]
MKLLNNNNNSRYGKPSFCYKYFKWLLWFSLSFYFFASFLFNHKPNNSTSSFISKTTVHQYSNKVSRALIESVSLKHHQDSLNGLKIYIYELPSRYNTDWLSNERCSNHLFASEVAIHRALLKSDVRTFDPYEADFFLIPVYVSCNFSKVNGFPAIGHARKLISSAIELISLQFPYWNRSLGSDHVFVASHDFGSCFHTLEDVAMADGVPEFLRNSIILQTFGVKYDHPCQRAEHVVIPPYVSPEGVRKTLATSDVNGRRDIFAFFRGKMEVHPKNVSGRYYSKKVRTVILQKYGNDRRFYLRRHRFAGYQSEILRSTFCLCPLGWAPWSPRLVESVVLGCVPVIIANGIDLPFSSAVPWSEISLTVPEKDVGKLGSILEHVASTNLSTLQQKLWDPRITRALMFHDRTVDGDATWQVLHALSQKLKRSHRRSRVFSE